MARVFRGVGHGPDGATRTVVIKRLRDHLAASAEAVLRFRNEAAVHAYVRHPNVVAIYEISRDAVGLFIALEWVDGASLKALVGRAAARGARLDPRVVLRIVIDALRGLSATHRARDEEGQALGILHRDATPDNILVGRDGQARLTDFGVAKCRGGPNLTGAGMVVGKLDYLPPEYLDRRAVDVRMDVYAMGVTAWVAIAGRRPFGREPGQCSAAHVRRVPQLDESMGLHPEVTRAIHRACEPEPRDRFQTAAAMAQALEELGAAHDGLATHGEVASAVKNLLTPIVVLPVVAPPPPPRKSWETLGIDEEVWREEVPTSVEIATVE